MKALPRKQHINATLELMMADAPLSVMVLQC